MNGHLPVTLIKIGGALLSQGEALRALWDGVRMLRSTCSAIVVHGGGPQATEMARRLGHEPKIVEGRRVTSDLDLDIMHWTVRGALNVRLVAGAIRAGIPAVGISGVDGGTLQVERRPPWEIEGSRVDFGWVGDIRKVDSSLLDSLLRGGFLPILAPLGIDSAGQTYNVNADTVARSVAEALEARRFLLITGTGGVLRRAGDPESLLETCSAETFDLGRREGWIRDGMLVKLKVAFDALAAGIPEVHIVSPADVVARSGGTRVVL